MTSAALRSVVVTPNILGLDGISTLSREISRSLPAPSLVLSLHDPEDRLSSGVVVRGAGGNRSRFMADVARAAMQCTADTAVVCTHLHLAPAARLLSWRGGRLTVVLCGIEAWVTLRAAERWALGGGGIVAISNHTASRFRAANDQFAHAEIAVCHPGLPAVSEEAGDHRMPEKAALIVARLSADERYKGHDELLDIWPDVLRHHADARLWIVGEGDDRGRLETRAASLGVASAVQFLGRVSEAELQGLYDRCAFFVMPSRDEGFGLVFLEAMRAGKACIGASGAAPEVIQHDETGLIVDPASHRQLSAAVIRLFDDPKTARRFGAAGRARFLSTFTDEQFQRRLGLVLHDAVPTSS
jgi:glycosyltransferase involved in cell wall biosynthesis